jgi:hypothetical protein
MPETKYAGKCVFCPLGEEAKRGVVEIEEEYDASHLIGTTLHSKYYGKKIYKYQCGLGEEGKECIIPQIYSMLAAAANRRDPRLDPIG